MLSVNDLNSFCQEAIQSVSDLKAYHLIITESHLSKCLAAHKAADSPFLVAVMPSARGAAPNEDALSWLNALMFMVLTKPLNYTSRKQDQELVDFQNTQEAILAFIDFMREKQGEDCHWLRQLNLNTLEVDPEYNMNSCDGWSLTFDAKTQ